MRASDTRSHSRELISLSLNVIKSEGTVLKSSRCLNDDRQITRALLIRAVSISDGTTSHERCHSIVRLMSCPYNADHASRIS